MSLVEKAMEKYSYSPQGPGEWSNVLDNRSGELSKSQLSVAGGMVAIIEMREKGRAPDHYTARTECKHCGPVPIFAGCPPEVDGCPWCFNRIKGLPIPRAIE